MKHILINQVCRSLTLTVIDNGGDNADGLSILSYKDTSMSIKKIISLKLKTKKQIQSILDPCLEKNMSKIFLDS